MTIRNLEHCLRPRSVAVIGASSDLGSVGNTLTQNILTGGFQGPVTLVNPHHTSIGDHRCFKSIEALPEAPELAARATPVIVVKSGRTAAAARAAAAHPRAVACTDAAVSAAFRRAGLVRVEE